MERQDCQRTSIALFSLAFAIGGVLGVALGLLFAPRSGRETRDRARSQMEEAGKKLQESAEKLRSRAEEMIASRKESGLTAGPSCADSDNSHQRDERSDLINA